MNHHCKYFHFNMTKLNNVIQVVQTAFSNYWTLTCNFRHRMLQARIEHSQMLHLQCHHFSNYSFQLYFITQPFFLQRVLPQKAASTTPSSQINAVVVFSNHLSPTVFRALSPIQLQSTACQKKKSFLLPANQGMKNWSKRNCLHFFILWFALYLIK